MNSLVQDRSDTAWTANRFLPFSLSQKNHVTRKYMASAHQLVESGKQPSDPRKNVHEFMNIEGKQ